VNLETTSDAFYFSETSKTIRNGSSMHFYYDGYCHVASL